MSTVETFIKSYEFNRGRTLDLLNKIEQLPNGAAILGWRPGPGRAHIAWQLMHVAVSEELFATERLNPGAPTAWHDAWSRFRGGSTPDEQIPTFDELRRALAETRAALLATLRQWGDARLDEMPEAFKSRGWTFLTVLELISWHEAHHQGQAHLTFNLHQSAPAASA